MDTKTCECCGTTFSRRPNASCPNWSAKRFCCRQCKNVFHSGGRYEKSGNKFWRLLEYMEIPLALADEYEQARDDARKWKRKCVRMMNGI